MTWSFPHSFSKISLIWEFIDARENEMTHPETRQEEKKKKSFIYSWIVDERSSFIQNSLSGLNNERQGALFERYVIGCFFRGIHVRLRCERGGNSSLRLMKITGLGLARISPRSFSNFRFILDKNDELVVRDRFERWVKNDWISRRNVGLRMT